MILHHIAMALAMAQSVQPSSAPAWQVAAGDSAAFDAASVRPSAPGTPYASNIPLDGADGPPPGTLFQANANLMAYLLFAFKINDSARGLALWQKLPDWGHSQLFTIHARAENSPSLDQMRLMMQSLLIDRFKLAFHREVQQRNLYSLQLGKPGVVGSGLKQHPADQPCIQDAKVISPMPAPAAGATMPHYCGDVMWRSGGVVHLQMIDVTMQQVATYLSGTGASLAGGSMPVQSGVDNTALAGHYDLEVSFVPESLTNDADVAGPRFADALNKQLGLKLVPQKGPVEIILLDHIETPTAQQ